jgi:hypothetical protein
MQYSIIQYNEMKKYDLGWLILSPDFYMPPKIHAIGRLKGNKTVQDYFEERNNTVKVLTEGEIAICYDLTHSLGNFFNNGDRVEQIDSMKKVGLAGNFAISRLRSYLKEMAIVPVNNTLQLLSSEYVVYQAREPRDFSEQSLMAFCLSNPVQTVLKYSQYGTEHPRFYEFVLNNLSIPKAVINLNETLTKIITRALSLNQQSNNLYSQAEQILLSELGLSDWKPRHQLSFIKNFSDTKTAERIDAEYYQPQYEKMIKAIKSVKDYDILGNIIEPKKCFEPGSEAYQDSGVPFLRVSNLSKFGINDDNQQFISEDLYESLKQHQPKKGEILLSKDATPGIAYYLKDEPGKMIPSSGILRLTVKNTKKTYPEYLTLVLNSVIVQKQIERDVGGSILNHWLVGQVKNTLIPILSDTIQKQISDKVDKSFIAREQSKRLLDIAKQGVEMAIEKDEKQAENWIKTELVNS